MWSNGRSWPHACFVIWALSNGGLNSRIGIVASRKIGNAVARNRARRLLREAIRHLYTLIEPGWDIILVARTNILAVKESEVEDALCKTLHRAKLTHSIQD